MFSYCLKYRKNTEGKQKNNAFIKMCGLQIVKNQDLSKNQKPADYYVA